MGRDAGNFDAPCAQLHHHQHIVGHQPMPGGDLNREEVRGSLDFPMKCEELGPAHAVFTSFRRGIDVVPP
jgi:hypothetical protein